MSRVLRSPAANDDILEIWLYFATESPDTADRILDSIDEKCRLIATQPHAGRPRDDLGRYVRSHPVGEHVVFYRPIDDCIEILRILHGARDIPAVFSQPK